ncbi:MAG: GNAT family N-acetyltransferase [Clostridia bacterium]|nr:GNAT family N-acetyltransferase [Clostridia bacterium]
MEIREARIEDVEQMIFILEQISKIHYENRPNIFKEKSKIEVEKVAIDTINDKDKKFIIVTDDTLKIYGLLICKIKDVKEHINLKDTKTLWIEEIGVDEKYRKRGIGKQLWKEAEKIAKELNCKRIELNCWNFNKDAINFYKSIGMNTQRKIMEKEIGG